MSFSAADHKFMSRALYLAKKGIYTTAPNPNVGCVLVKDGKVIGEGEKTRALVMDAIGSVAAETLAELTNKEIINIVSKKGFSTSRRFSPGYGDWNISGQKDLLAWVGAPGIGIKLSDTYQMIPEKSVSAVLGVTKNGH